LGVSKKRKADSIYFYHILESVVKKNANAQAEKFTHSPREVFRTSQIKKIRYHEKLITDLRGLRYLYS